MAFNAGPDQILMFRKQGNLPGGGQ
jgi:hypothetical protein